MALMTGRDWEMSGEFWIKLLSKIIHFYHNTDYVYTFNYLTFCRGLSLCVVDQLDCYKISSLISSIFPKKEKKHLVT